MMRLYDAQNNDDDEESMVRRIWTYIRMKESFDVTNFLKELRTRKPTQKTSKKVSLSNRIDSVISKLTASTDQNNNNNSNINQNEDPIVVLMDTSDCDEISIDIDSKAISAKINNEDEDEDESDDDDDENNNLLPMTTRDIDFEFKKSWCNAKRGKREPNWEIMWRSLTETLNELRNNNDESYLEYYTLILKLHVQHKIKLSYKCNESLLNCLEPSYISSLFDLKLIDPQEFNYIYSIYEKNYLFSAFKTNPFESNSLHPFFLIMSYSVLLYKTKCKPYQKQILNAIQKELAIMINLSLFDEKFKKIGVKCFLKAVILNGLFDRESLNAFLDSTDKSSNSFNIRMIRINHGHHHFHDDDSDEFDEEDEDEDSEMDDESENFDEDEEIDHDDEEDEDDFFNSDSDEVDNDALLAQQAVIRQNIEQAPNNYAPRSPSQPPPPQLPAPPVPPQRMQVLGRRMPVERRVEPAAPAVEPPVAPPKKKSVADYIDTNNDLRNIFPLSLKNLVRIKIKNSMNVYDECNVLKLKVQNVLCKFILFQDEIDSIVKSVNQAKAPKPVASTNSNNGTNSANNN
jgi:hypothetical protein